MRVLVVGNCQANPLSRCLAVMAPGVQVKRLNIHQAPIEKLAYALLDADVVVSQPLSKNEVGALIGGSGRPIVYYPRIAFPALQPDQVRVTSKEGRLPSSVVDLHSALIFHGWRRKLSASAIHSLFCEEVFERLGYFDLVDASMKAAAKEGEATGIDLPALIRRWLQRESFIHIVNHPKLFAISDIARHVLARLDITPTISNPEDLLVDPALSGPVWPVYPEIAARFGFRGSRSFKCKNPGEGGPGKLLSLQEFIVASLERYERHRGSDLRCTADEGRLFVPTAERSVVARDEGELTPMKVSQGGAETNPYRQLPEHQFWRRAVSKIEPAALDPVVAPKFRISCTDAIATAGSCFAQHIARRLQASGYHYLVTETPPSDMKSEAARNLQFGVYTARYGNVYTPRQLRQLFERTVDRSVVELGAWQRETDGRFIDPYRPEIVGEGFASSAAVLTSRTEHLGAVLQMMGECRVLVFTLGLTEAWADQRTGHVVPLAPGVVGASSQQQHFQFVNFRAEEARDDLFAALDLLHQRNPHVRVLLTVSPVPLIATYESQHVLTATTLSKSVLRVAAEEAKRHFSFCDYFPSYEIITSQSNRGRYFGEDLRSVTSEGVDHVMRIFMKHYCSLDAVALGDAEAALAVVCEEERLDQDS